jgi:hypothetical protein
VSSLLGYRVERAGVHLSGVRYQDGRPVVEGLQFSLQGFEIDVADVVLGEFAYRRPSDPEHAERLDG